MKLPTDAREKVVSFNSTLRTWEETMMSTMNSRLVAALPAAAAASLALLLMMAGTARADVNLTVMPPATAATIAGCNKLPLSQRAFRKSQVGWREVGGLPLAIDQTASARTASEMAACLKLPLGTMRQYMCEGQAGYGQAVPEQYLSSSQIAALKTEDARYEAAVAACRSEPYSAEATPACIEQAGQDDQLIGTIG